MKNNISIGFKNFRKYEDFPMMELGKINFMVGANGSGKSTANKSLLLALRNIRNLVTDNANINDGIPSFDMYVNELGINDESIKNAFSYSNVSDFSIGIGNYLYTITVKDMCSDKRMAYSGKRLYIIALKCCKDDIELFIDFSAGNATLTFCDSVDEQFHLKFKYPSFTEICERFLNTSLYNEGTEGMLRKRWEDCNWIDPLLSIKDIYIKAHKVSQTTTYKRGVLASSLDDVAKFNESADNYMQSVVTAFHDSGASDNEEIMEFLCKWLKKFDIAEGIEISSNLDYCTAILSVKRNEEVKIHLSQLGMGQIQIVIMLLHMCLIRHLSASRGSRRTVTVEKEEEMMNLGWSTDIINSIRTNEEAQIYIDAQLVDRVINEKHVLVPLNINRNYIVPEWWIKKYGEAWRGWTNADLMEKGYAPLDDNGDPYELHHIGQTTDSPLVVLSWGQHHQDGNFTILHTLDDYSDIGRSEFDKIKKNFWMSFDSTTEEVTSFDSYPRIILIILEEPEQNLHPNSQSKLAELFNNVYDEWGFRFIVETHSEYIIRRSQVWVVQQHYGSKATLQKRTPFKTYCFPEKGMPYDMDYNSNGRFTQRFATGFFDESKKLIMEIL